MSQRRFQGAILDALGLQGRYITSLILTCDGAAGTVTVQYEEVLPDSTGEKAELLRHVLDLATWTETETTRTVKVLSANAS